jgi:TonB family protein
VVRAGIRGSDYARELLAIAQHAGGHATVSSAAIGMAQRKDLRERLRSILQPQEGVASRLPLAAIAALSATTLTVSAVTIVPQRTYTAGGHSMKRTLLSGLLASAGLSAATIAGSVYDPNGAAIANAQASIYNPDTSFKQEIRTSPDGKFAFESLGAGSYILRVDKAGFAPLYREFNVNEDSDVQRGLVLTAASRSEANQAAVQSSQPIRVPGRIAEDNLSRKVQPVYPAAAKQAHVQGTVEMDVTISKDGVPEDIRVLRSPSDDLTQSALDAVRQWRYRPTLLNGRPAPIETDVIVNYTLSE